LRMAYLRLIVVIIIAVVGLGLPSQAQTWQSIRLVSTSHEVSYPSEISFHMKAVSDAEITDVRLFYRVSGRDVTVYGYPEFVPSKRIAADFRLRLDGGNYLPPGVEIQYYYVIRDASGSELETARFSLEYLDPAFDWQRLTAGNMTVLWHDRPRQLVADVAADVSQQLARVKHLLRLDTVKPQKAVIFSTASEAAEGFPLVSATATQQHVYGGFAMGDFDVFVLAGLNRDGMIHEMTHLYIDEALGSPGARIPSWLNEGLAMYFESGPKGKDKVVADAALAGRLLPLRGMGSVPGKPVDVSIFYAQSLSIVTYLMDTYGPERMSSLLDKLKQGEPIDEAVLLAYGMSLEELEADWKTELAGRAAFSSLPDPGTLGTSAMIGGAIAFTVLVLVLRWIKRIFNPPTAEDADI
jgi:hypothetical protein